MKIQSKPITALFAVGLIFSILVACAQAITISPVHLSMSVKKPIISLTVTNDSARIMTFQTKTVIWSQVNGDNVYSDTNDFMITPPIVSIQANSSQVFRLALFRNSPHLVELSYRVILEDITAELASEENGLSFKFNHSLPLMYAPITPLDSVLWTRCESNVVGKSCLRMDNQGNRHTKLVRFNAVSTTAQVPYEGAKTVLAGSSAQWFYTTMIDAENTTHLEVTTNNGIETLIIEDLLWAN
jgi:P pilus assembly chaperone PapD